MGGLGDLRAPRERNEREFAPERVRRVQVPVRLTTAQLRALKQLALDDETTVQYLLLGALRSEFSRRGLTPFPD